MTSIVEEKEYNSEITLFSDSSLFSKTKNNSLYIELSKLQFPENIIERAIDIHQSMNIPNKRGRNRTKLKIILIYYAYKSMGIVYDINKLAKYFGISDPGEITRTFSKFSSGKIGYDLPDLDANPEDFIEEYYAAAGILNNSFESFRPFAIVIFKKIISDNIHHEYYPQIIAAATIIYYLKLNGIKDVSKFCKKIHQSEVTLNEAARFIETVYNT